MPAPRPSRPTPPGPPPPTRRNDHVDVIHGVEIHDPYRWLEDESDPAVQAWVEAQDAYSAAVLRRLPGRAAFRRRLRQLLNVGSVGAPVERGGRLFYTSLRAGQNQAVVRVRSGARDEVLINPNRLSPDGTIALDWWYPSEDGTLVAYGLSSGGDELSTLYVRQVRSRRDLPDRLERTRAASVAWLPDGSGFYYTRLPFPGEVPSGEEQYHRRVFLHRLGDEQGRDALIFAPAQPEAWPHLALSPDGRYLLILVLHGWSRSDVYLLDRSEPAPALRPIVVGEQAYFDGEVVDGVLYLRTNLGAPNYRLIALDPRRPERAAWRELVAESDTVLSSFTVAAGHLVLHRLVHATSRLELRTLDGALRGTIPLPGSGTVTGIDGRPDGETIYFGYTSFTTPPAAYAFRPGEQEVRVVAAPRAPAWLAAFQPHVEQVRYPSKDGTRVSLFLLRGAEQRQEGPRPTLLTGYGGFNVSHTPAFTPMALAWIEQGGVWALANLRGGGEYGEAWHRAGMLDRKQNVFDDFIAAAGWLISQGLTTPAQLAIAGGSNGGLLVGAAMTQRPELFRAVLCMVPLLDMVRYHHFRIARLWIPEYGSAEDPRQFSWLYAYSPYHRVRPGERYPAVLLTTGEQDSRVDPLHARKMAARLQAEAAPGRPVLLRVERQAGHGAGKPVAKLVEEQADALAFLAWQTGLGGNG